MAIQIVVADGDYSQGCDGSHLYKQPIGFLEPKPKTIHIRLMHVPTIAAGGVGLRIPLILLTEFGLWAKNNLFIKTVADFAPIHLNLNEHPILWPICGTMRETTPFVKGVDLRKTET